MIVSLTPNPAVDVTYTARAFDPHGTTRVRSITERAGGKGINVARVAAVLGSDVTVVAPVGGHAGDWLREALHNEGVPVVGVAVSGETRRTITVVDESGDHPPTLTEPGAKLTTDEWKRLVRAAVETSYAGDVVTISGSLPLGVEAIQLGAAVRSLHGRLVIVDTSGSGLWAAAEAGANVLKPNADELRDATGEDDLVVAATLLLRAGAGSVVVSAGPDGLMLVSPDGAFRTVGLERAFGNPVGAGDATVAGLAHRLTAGASLLGALPFAAACGAAAVVRPTAGEIDLSHLHRALETLRTQELP